MNTDSGIRQAEDGVSFVLPVFNKVPYLPAVCRALADQAGDFSREFIFVDDGSTDGSAALIEQLTDGWENVTILRQSNHGSAHATNQGIARARMPFIKFVDADDLVGRHGTRLLLDVLRREPSAVVSFGDVVFFPLDGPDPDLTSTDSPGAATLLENPVRAAIRNSLFNPTQCLARTEAVRRAGGCDERVVFSQEYTLTLRLARLGSFVKIAAPVAWRPETVPGSLSTNEARQLQRVTMSYAWFLRDYPDLPPMLKFFAARRAAGRAWKFARRHRGAGWLNSAWPWRYLLAHLPLPRDHAAFIEGCAAAFD